MDEAAREKQVRERIQDIGAETFPDDAVEWRVLSVRHDGDYTLVTAESSPASVGYPRFVFVQHFDAGGRMQDCACYVMAQDRWSLLCSNPEAPAGWKGIRIDR